MSKSELGRSKDRFGVTPGALRASIMHMVDRMPDGALRSVHFIVGKLYDQARRCAEAAAEEDAADARRIREREENGGET